MAKRRKNKRKAKDVSAESKPSDQTTLFEAKDKGADAAPQAEPEQTAAEEAVKPKIEIVREVPNEPETPDAAPEEAESETDALRRERDEYIELAQRARAELENYRRRVVREREVEKSRLQGEILREILNPLDDLDRALKAAKDTNDFDSLYDGLRMVRDGFWKGLEQSGLERIPAEPGVTFDPNWHEGMVQVPHPDVPANAIVEEVSPGYRLGDFILRASKVVVSGGPPADLAEGEDG